MQGRWLACAGHNLERLNERETSVYCCCSALRGRLFFRDEEGVEPNYCHQAAAAFADLRQRAVFQGDDTDRERACRARINQVESRPLHGR